MTTTTRLRAVLLACAVVSASTASAQSAREPRFTFDAGGTRVIAVSNLPENEGCYPGTIIGRVVERRLDKGKLTGVTVKDDRYETYINTPDAYEFRNRATYDRVRDALDTLLVPGVDLRIKSVACGAAGRVVHLESVALRNPGAVTGTERPLPPTGSEPTRSTARDDGDRVLLQAPGGSREPAAAVQAERGEGGVRSASAAPSLPTRTAWRASALTKVQFDMAIASTDRAAGWSITCTRNVKGQVHFGNWLVGSRTWSPNAQSPRVVIDGVRVPWEMDGADEGVVLSDSMQDNATTLSPHARAQIARGERLIIAGSDRRNRPRDMVFDISGGEAAFAAFEARCQTLPRS